LLEPYYQPAPEQDTLKNNNSRILPIEPKLTLSKQLFDLNFKLK